MISQDSQSQHARVSVDTASEGGPIPFFLLHTLVSHNTPSCHFSSLKGSVERELWRPQEKVLFCFVFDGDILSTPGGSSLSQHRGWEFVEGPEESFSFQSLQGGSWGVSITAPLCSGPGLDGTAHVHTACFSLPSRDIALLVLIMLSSQPPHVTSATQPNLHKSARNKGKKCGRTSIIWNSQIYGPPSLA